MDKNKANQNQNLSKPIVMIGMMGCGKTHIGELLAKTMDRVFYDSDVVIEQMQQRSIAEIFASDGEATFRIIEKKTILEMLDQPIASVISTGGGAVTIEGMMDILKDRAIIIWVQADIDVIWARVKDDESRPLLQNDDPKATLCRLHERRKLFYEQAHIHIRNNGDDADAIDNIMRELKHFL